MLAYCKYGRVPSTGLILRHLGRVSAGVCLVPGHHCDSQSGNTEAHMGLLGNYVDGLPDTAKDRIIRAQDWCAEGVPDDSSSMQSLLGHAEGYGPRGKWAAGWSERASLRASRLWRFGPSSRSRIGGRFTRACYRFGRERTVRALKLRAASQYMPSARMARRQSS